MLMGSGIACVILVVLPGLQSWIIGIAAQQHVGDKCSTKQGSVGVCVAATSCWEAFSRGGTAPEECGSQGNMPIVCCTGGVNQQPSRRITVYRPSPFLMDDEPLGTVASPDTLRGRRQNRPWFSTFTENVRPPSALTENVRRPRRTPQSSGDDKPRLLTQEEPFTDPGDLVFEDQKPSSPKKRISVTMCDEYSKDVTETLLVIPLLPKPKPIERVVENCDYKGLPLIVGGNKTKLGEFPHMAAIGFRENDDIEWRCGGTLISDQYVLTAAHCTVDPPPEVVRLGELNLRQTNDGAHPVDIPIVNITRHPEYDWPIKYNDIALLRLESKLQFTKFIRPACLYQRDSFTEERVIATGWGKIAFAEDPSDHLLKVSIRLIDNKVCNSLYRTESKTGSLRRGILPSMMCAGELSGVKDTCQGDSGGPLQVTKDTNHCVHDIVGVTSFGKICGSPNAPGIYTRVSAFVPWIESIVWPQ